MPVIHPNALVGVSNLRVPSRQVPLLSVERRVVDPDVGFNCARVRLLPDFHCFHLLALVRLIPAHGAFHELIGMDHQLLAVPEADGITVIERIPVFDRRVVTSIGIDPADVVYRL